MLLDTFQLTAVEIGEVDRRQLHALSIGVRWPHREDDWDMLTTFGVGVAALDEIDRVVGSAMMFPYTEEFATIGMVIIPPRLQAQGGGRWLMDEVLSRAEGRSLGLNATRAARRLYQSIGFTEEATVYQCNGIAVLPPDDAAGPGLRAVRPNDTEDLIALDARAFGVRRDDLLRHLLTVSEGTILVRDGRIVAFALCRRFGKGHVVGPVVASGDEDAIAVTRPHVRAHAGRFLRLDTRQGPGDFASFLSASGLPVFDTVTTMSLGRAWLPRARGGQPITYGLVSQALG